MSFWMVPVELLVRDALFFGGDDVERHDRQHRAVHGHRDRHLIQRNAAEQDFHVEDRVDRHARLADIADHARMVGVVAAMGGEIERNRQTLLTRGQIAAIEGVGFLGGGEARVLAHRPRLGHVHGRIRPAQERRHPGDIAQMLQIFDVVVRIQRLDIDLFHRRRHQLLQRLAGSFFHRGFPLGKTGFGEIHPISHRGEIR
jgi:hypothetical protein